VRSASRFLSLGLLLLAASACRDEAQAADTRRVEPSDFTWLGAIRLPDVGERPTTFAYSGNAMTFNPHGDAGGEGDGYPGSLIITGHESIAYGEVPDGNQLAEASIPTPVAS
jgi:hypothetical protein